MELRWSGQACSASDLLAVDSSKSFLLVLITEAKFHKAQVGLELTI